MNIKFIAMGVLSATLISSAVFADDVQQNTQSGNPSQTMSSPGMDDGSAMTQPAMPQTQATNQTDNAAMAPNPAMAPNTTENPGNANTNYGTDSTTQPQPGNSY